MIILKIISLFIYIFLIYFNRNEIFYSRTLIIQKLPLLKLLSRKVQNEDKIF